MRVPVLEMKGISKRFPGVVALDSVDLDIHSGEVVALAGENGAGKSTLMKILGGLHQPDNGQIRIDNQPVAIRSVSEAMSRGIAFIHQELNVLDNLDVAGNVFLGREPVWGGPLRLIDQRKIHFETKRYLERLGLEVPSETPLRNLSIAQQQMVEIAKAVSLQARILIMDEPTSSLTLNEAARLLELIKELRAQRVSIIYISHRLTEIMEIADRVVVLRDGRNAGLLSREEIGHHRIVRLMVGRDLNRFYTHAEFEGRPRIFEIRKLRTRRYPGSVVSLDIDEGEIVGMAGLVGAGRSEVAQAVCGVDTPLEVTILLDGQPLSIRSPRDAVRHGIYLVPEDRRQNGLIVDAAIRENITLPALERYASAGWVHVNRERQAASAICEKLGVRAPSMETKVSNLSGGNQQKVVLAKWLALDPKVLILDEPTRGIDVGAKAEIYQLMRNLAERGIGILMISSDMEEILHISHRVAVMHEGAVVGILERHQCNEETIMRLAVGSN